jgi:hypothetical protein
MLKLLQPLDELLRGDRTRDELLAQDHAALSLRTFLPAGVALGLAYGFFMGWFALSTGGNDAMKQALSTMVKLPAVFLVTLLVTFPSLYVFNALVGCKLRFATTLRLLIAAIVVNLAVAAALGPILGFFTLSTTSYPFMVLLNVVLLGIGGLIGLAFLLRTLRRLALAGATADLPPPPEPPVEEERAVQLAPPGEGAQGSDAPPVAFTPPSTLPPRRVPPSLSLTPARAAYYAQLSQREALIRERTRAANGIFRIWVVLYGVVGMQTGWILRPFIGHPDLPFALLRAREGNVFQGLWRAAGSLLGL